MLFLKSKSVVSILLFGFLIFFSSHTFAQPGMDDFNQGVKAARAGDYRTALTHFQKAEKAGMDSQALQYNLGVSYYQLGQYDQARQVFASLKKVSRYQQLAYYNLGLIADKQDKKSEAITAFQLAYQSGDSDKVTALSREALKRLGAKPKKSSKPTKNFSGLASVSFNSDNNVTTVNEDLVGETSQSDSSFVLSGYGAYWLTGNTRNGLRLLGRAYKQQYNTVTEYDYMLLGVGIAYYDRLGDWRMRYGGFWDETSLGSSSYQQTYTAEVRGRKNISRNNQLRLRYKGSQISSTNTTYDYLQGTKQQFRAGLRFRNSKTSRIRAYYELELNDRDDREYSVEVDPGPPADIDYYFKSYSSTRQTFRITGWWDITEFWELRLDGRYRTSKYNDDNSFTDSSAGITTTELREDTQTRLSARLSRELSKGMDLEMTYTATKNDSSIDAESYDRNIAGIGLAWTF